MRTSAAPAGGDGHLYKCLTQGIVLCPTAPTTMRARDEPAEERGHLQSPTTMRARDEPAEESGHWPRLWFDRAADQGWLAGRRDR
jgi:hypothetical protein